MRKASRRKASKRFLVLAIICTIIFGAWATLRIVKGISFDINCHAYIHRAAGATDIETAKVELTKAIEYIEENNLTEGTVSIFLKNPKNDVGFWYDTLKCAYKELDTFSEDTTQLEKTNYLMRMRESFLEIGLPHGISIYPNNVLYFWWSMLSLISAAVFYFLSDIAYVNNWN